MLLFYYSYITCKYNRTDTWFLVDNLWNVLMQCSSKAHWKIWSINVLFFLFSHFKGNCSVFRFFSVLEEYAGAICCFAVGKKYSHCFVCSFFRFKYLNLGSMEIPAIIGHKLQKKCSVANNFYFQNSLQRQTTEKISSFWGLPLTCEGSTLNHFHDLFSFLLDYNHCTF